MHFPRIQLLRRSWRFISLLWKDFPNLWYKDLSLKKYGHTVNLKSNFCDTHDVFKLALERFPKIMTDGLIFGKKKCDSWSFLAKSEFGHFRHYKPNRPYHCFRRHLLVSKGFTSSPFFYERSYNIQKTRKRKENHWVMSIKLDLFRLILQFVLSNHRVAALNTFLFTRCFQNWFKSQNVSDISLFARTQLISSARHWGQFTFNFLSQ